MADLTTLAVHLQQLLLQEVEELERGGFRQRDSSLAHGAFVQAVVFGALAEPLPTLEQFAQVAALAGAAVTPQAIDQRFTDEAARLLQRLLGRCVRRALTAAGPAAGLLGRFAGVRVQDSTVVMLPAALAGAWPGCGGSGPADGRAGVKLQVQLDLATGELAGPFPFPARQPDQAAPFQAAAVPAGTLVLADLGYFDLDKFARYQRGGVRWLSRYQPWTPLFDAAGAPLELLAFLGRQGGAVVDVPVQVGASHRLAARLVAFRVPPEVAARRRQRARKKARDRGRAPGAGQLALCDWNVYLTNVPPAQASAAELQVLARCRWQIELLFKLWKSEGRLGESRSRRPARVLCELWGKLIGLVIQHWLLVATCWQHRQRSLRKASRGVRQTARLLAWALPEAARLVAVLRALARSLQKAARLERRRKKPNHAQLLEQPTAYGETP
jgi:hypothetical protein